MYLNFRFHFFMPLFGNFQVSFLHIVGLLGIEVVSHTSKNKYVQLYSPLTFLLLFGVLFLQEKDDKKCGGIYYLCTSNAFYFSELLYNKVSSWHLRFFFFRVSMSLICIFMRIFKMTSANQRAKLQTG